MQNQNTQIFFNDSDVDVTHKINTIELDNWMSHLKYIKKEITNLINLCNTDLSLQLQEDNVLKSLHKKEVENENLRAALNRYAISRTDIMECEDTQCDMVYITEHESYRKRYLQFIEGYRKLKNEFFNKVQGTFTLTAKH
ncbi:hypothetical protein [Hwangdonia lutea]|uniref:Uncharacterized protein n=1 Tax=Hwangdonia lutea TaxID=3075823 RepID=A0AA97EQD0_9FLAO|nr:hypothetical protein [Hwangdonia sp. SCSIO 19198]WOD44540.1 hypothetical protein RNZ46_04610 [Hwangdonia sp. SCSIO 19198]